MDEKGGMRVSLYDDLNSRKMKGKVQWKKLAAPLRPNVAKPLIMMMMMMIMMMMMMMKSEKRNSVVRALRKTRNHQNALAF